MAGGTKPAPHTRKAEKFQDGAKKSGGRSLQSVYFADIRNPDAELLDLCSQLDRLHAQLKAWFKEQAAAYERYRYPTAA